ncbi:MAG: hypothetical protein Q4C67_06725, partial [Deinococcus sp.]|nr:hypothetical protein [Deinococcus sp.]
RRAAEQDAAGAGAGPYPLYPAVLAEALAVADHRLPQGTPLPEVAQRAAALYRRLLAELGHGARTQEAGAQESRAQESSPQTSGAGGPTAEEARDLR